MRNVKALILVCLVNSFVVTMLFITVTYPLRKKLEDLERVKNTFEQQSPVHRVDPKERARYVLDAFSEPEEIPILQNFFFEPRPKRQGDRSELCPETPRALKGTLKTFVDGTSPSWSMIALQNFMVKDGGFVQTECNARYRVAIIIPMHGEVELLKSLVNHLHPILRRQQLNYTIYTITNAEKEAYNRGKLLNAGFAEAYKDGPFDCYVFHDVNLLLQDDGCLYWCSDKPRQISFYIDRFKYKKLVYQLKCAPIGVPTTILYSGGVTSIPHNLFVEINGFSNLFWGRGGDDDDLYYRLWKKGHNVTNPYAGKCSFTTMKYRHDDVKVNRKAPVLLYHSTMRMEHDGLTSLRYKRLGIERGKLYVNITVDLGRLSKNFSDFMLKPIPADCGTMIMPWD